MALLSIAWHTCVLRMLHTDQSRPVICTVMPRLLLLLLLSILSTAPWKSWRDIATKKEERNQSRREEPSTEIWNRPVTNVSLLRRGLDGLFLPQSPICLNICKPSVASSSWPHSDEWVVGILEWVLWWATNRPLWEIESVKKKQHARNYSEGDFSFCIPLKWSHWAHAPPPLPRLPSLLPLRRLLLCPFVPLPSFALYIDLSI